MSPGGGIQPIIKKSDAPLPIHVIRLHAAWRRTERRGTTVLAERSAISLPDGVPIDPSAMTVTYHRKFNLPTGLEDSNRIQFASELLQVSVRADFNGLPLDIAAQPSAVDITERLQKHNEIAIDLPAGAMETVRTATAQLRILPS